MRYEYQYVVEAPLEKVSGFFRKGSNLKAITPPLLPITGFCAPYHLSSGDHMTFTLWMGPLPVRWVARIEEYTPTGFIDRQDEGPFKEWIHRHHFQPLDDDRVLVQDSLTFRFKGQPLSFIPGLLMSLGLPLLFRYRAYRTKEILNRSS